MGRYIKRNDVISLAIVVEVGRVVAFVAIEDKEAIYTDYTTLGVLIEVFYPIQANLVYSPTIFAYINSPVLWELAVLVPREKVIFALNDNIRRQYLASCTYTLDHCNKLPVTQLLRTRLSASFGACNNLYARKYAYLKPGLIEVINICLLHAVLSNCIPYKRKPSLHDLRIFTLYPLVVDLTSETCIELEVALDEVLYLSGSDV